MTSKLKVRNTLSSQFKKDTILKDKNTKNEQTNQKKERNNRILLYGIYENVPVTNRKRRGSCL